MLGVILTAALAAIAWLAFDRQAVPPLERYRRLGPEAGAAALRRDLLAEVPVGSPVAPLLHRLETLGLRCTRPGDRWICGTTLLAEGRRLLQMEVIAGVEAERLTTLDTRLAESSP